MESSGFFDAELDESTGTYDLEYLSSQFAAYFAQFIGNGVFGSPTNQLKVRAGNGLKVIVPEGWAFINGYWYYNDSDKELVVPTNASSQIRTDSVMCRFDDSNRRITALYINGSVDVIRDGTYFDLKLAEVIVPPASTNILESNITDTRINEDVCGFVTGLLEVQSTKDLFAQYQSIFDEWFEGIKGKLGEDVAGSLQLQIDTISDDLVDTVPYNLIPFPYYEGSHTDNGIDWVVNEDGSVTANGTATADSIFNVVARTQSNPFRPQNGIYTLSGCPSGGNTKTYAQYLQKGSSSAYIGSLGVDTGNGVTCEVVLESEEKLQIQVYIQAGQTVENLTFKPMLVKGDTAKEFRKNFKSVYEMQQYLNGTLTTGETTLTISDSSITTDSIIDIYTNVFGVNPTEVTVADGSITLVFDSQESDLGVKVRVM